MPFQVVARRGGYFVRNMEDGRLLSREPLSKARAKRQLWAVNANYRQRRAEKCRRCGKLRGAGWWDDITGFFTKVYDETIGKIPVIGDIGRRVAETVFNPINTAGKAVQAATEGDWKGVGSELLAGVKRTVSAPSLAESLTAGTPLEGAAKVATAVARSAVQVPGTGMSVGDLADMVTTAADTVQEIISPSAPAEEAAPEPEPAPEVAPSDVATTGEEAASSASPVPRPPEEEAGSVSTEAGAEATEEGELPWEASPEPEPVSGLQAIAELWEAPRAGLASPAAAEALDLPAVGMDRSGLPISIWDAPARLASPPPPIPLMPSDPRWAIWSKW